MPKIQSYNTAAIGRRGDRDLPRMSRRGRRRLSRDGGEPLSAPGAFPEARRQQARPVIWPISERTRLDGGGQRGQDDSGQRAAAVETGLTAGPRVGDSGGGYYGRRRTARQDALIIICWYVDYAYIILTKLYTLMCTYIMLDRAHGTLCAAHD